MLKNLKNAEWSKKLLVFIELLIIATFILVMIATLKGDASALVALITGVFSLASLAFGFYYWKAKNENIRKYAEKIDKKDINKVVAMYDAIMNEDNQP
jgi:formate hydrogenlyase subunit 3/multisubunit Na+/H+ antiporter MnhD subunit